MSMLGHVKVAVVGLGYVGLPLAVEFGRKYPTVGFDLKHKRIFELIEGKDSTREVDEDELRQARQLHFTAAEEDLAGCNVFIVAVPTPIDVAKRPDLGFLEGASEIVGRQLKRGDHVIYESTVYPGATEEVCIPILEKVSGLRLNEDFACGYSPERINPGDRQHRLTTIVKVTSGSNEKAAEFVDQLYKSIITAGTFKASSIKVAEAAKVIENTQRDVNIALVNELALIFNKLSINTAEVLRAAGTKWNFLPFTPGLVGGHCIGVDPYYLTHKAQQMGYHPAMILAGRRLNDDMGRYIASRFIKLMVNKGIDVSQARVLVMGITFKENCPDLRNTRVVDIIQELQEYGIHVVVHDPWVSVEDARQEYGITLTENPEKGAYDGIVMAVAHRQFLATPFEELKALCKDSHVVYDVKNVLPAGLADGTL